MDRPQGSPAPQGPQLDPSIWLWSEVQSGVATLTAPLVDAFVPQMLNYESVGGVNFKKGCYPGQEVVARSQFRAHSSAVPIWRTPAATCRGQQKSLPPTTWSSLAARWCRLRLAARGVDALVSLQIAATEQPLQVGAAGGVALAVANPCPTRCWKIFKRQNWRHWPSACRNAQGFEGLRSKRLGPGSSAHGPARLPHRAHPPP